uniref:Carboxymuconolactone decarboxylase-like domain-containing protein n=1 Tax=Scophthalmus maximus TaxID=52904 RepID=A0A8D3E7P3_SCOMX
MATQVISKLFRPAVFTQLAALRLRGKVAAAAAGTRHLSSDPPPEKVSRYPVPYRTDLPVDIVELMEEVETKVKKIYIYTHIEINEQRHYLTLLHINPVVFLPAELVSSQGGFLPNVFKVLSHRPAEFRAFFAYYNELMNKETGGLTKADRELIVVATSIHNKCLYCVVAHSALHRIYSKKPTLSDQVVVNYENAELGPRERAMLDFAMAVCRCDTITEQHFQALEEVGFDREDAWDIAAIAAFFAMSNRLAHLTDMRPNLEFYNMGRLPRDKSKDK